VQIVLFHSRLDDAVARITMEDGRFMRVNRDELRSTGIELAGSYALGPVALAADLTLQDVELTDTQASQTNRPENLPEVFGSLNAHFPLLAGVEGGIGVEHTGEQFSIDRETGGDSRLPAQAIVNASISRAWPMTMSWVAGLFSSLETRCAVENVGDAPLYDAAGLPEPGRRIRFEVRMR
jgi:outer membrane receptor protein involved in Fe transport